MALTTNYHLYVSFKITKKLAGHGKGTALWVSSLSNEVGQILTSVL